MATKTSTKKAKAVGKDVKRKASRKVSAKRPVSRGRSSDVMARVLLHAMEGHIVNGRLVLGVPKKEAPEVLAHREREDRTDGYITGRITPPKAPSRRRVGIKPVRVRRAQLEDKWTVRVVEKHSPIIKSRPLPYDAADKRVEQLEALYPKALVFLSQGA